MSRFTLLLWGAILSPIIVVPSILLEAWVATKLWAWFVVPTFGLAPLRLVVAVGLLYLISLVTNQYIATKDKGSTGQLFFYLFGRPFVVLVIGYVAHLFV